jgi:outer membrane protein assembly factor BamA
MSVVRLIVLALMQISFLSTNLSAQDTLPASDPCDTMDLGDVFRKLFKIKKPPKPKTSAIFIAPSFSSSPATGFAFGATVQGAFRMGTGNLSAFQVNALYTTKNQVMIFLKNNIYAKNNKIFLSGDWRYFSYTETTFGLGTNAPEGSLPYYQNYNGLGDPTDSLAQPMKFNYFKVHQTMSFIVWPGFYAGPGIHLDLYSNIQDLKLDTALREITSHYAYSKKNDFDPREYTVFGLSLNLVYDTRDNIVNSYKGMYANLNFRVNPEFLGSDHNSSSLWAEYRYFTNLSKKEAKILAFWFIGSFTTSGKMPYLNLPALGYDQRSKSGRGYASGRFRGQQMLYAETEYRFPISKCNKFLGGVVFLNATSTNNKDAGISLLKYIQPGVGVGLRVLFNKTARMNMQIDYGVGKEGGGVYFGASEVF